MKGTEAFCVSESGQCMLTTIREQPAQPKPLSTSQLQPPGQPNDRITVPCLGTPLTGAKENRPELLSEDKHTWPKREEMLWAKLVTRWVHLQKIHRAVHIRSVHFVCVMLHLQSLPKKKTKEGEEELLMSGEGSRGQMVVFPSVGQ